MNTQTHSCWIFDEKKNDFFSIWVLWVSKPVYRRRKTTEYATVIGSIFFNDQNFKYLLYSMTLHKNFFHAFFNSWILVIIPFPFFLILSGEACRLFQILYLSIYLSIYPSIYHLYQIYIIFTYLHIWFLELRNCVLCILHAWLLTCAIQTHICLYFPSFSFKS